MAQITQVMGKNMAYDDTDFACLGGRPLKNYVWIFILIKNEYNLDSNWFLPFLKDWMISNRKVTYDSFLAKEDINYSNVFLPGIVAWLIHGI